MDKFMLLEDREHGDNMFPFRVYTVDYLDGDAIFNVHWHHELEFIYVEEGKINLQVGTENHTLREGQAFYIPTGQLHGAFPIDKIPFKLHAIVFHFNLLRSFSYDRMESNYLEQLENPAISSAVRLLPNESEGEILKIVNKLIDAYVNRRPSLELVIKGYLFLLFAEMFDKQVWKYNDQISFKDSNKITLLKTVLKYMNKNYNQKLTVLDLAAQVQMSEGHFSRFFKSLVRMTPMEYLNKIRISNACKLLQKTDKKMIEIAMDVGFNNQSYFIRLFKKQKGCTPIAYKRKNPAINLSEDSSHRPS
ncbi:MULTISPECIES: AraC family transcriptional regulator [Paraliobacillus]|uniref:AraC family transcriptional regulator n=1 Tax=Paraliobacillus TaxID=200903 RepID=UPI000DD493FD|nr:MULTISPECIES: AraC family transcriptional regulator [Paraliobacillus]